MFSSTIIMFILPAILVAAASVLSIASAASLSKVKATKPVLRVLPLGASITWGQHSTTRNGYRKPLYDMLSSTGRYDVTFVGSKHNGDMTDNVRTKIVLMIAH